MMGTKLNDANKRQIKNKSKIDRPGKLFKTSNIRTFSDCNGWSTFAI